MFTRVLQSLALFFWLSGLLAAEPLHLALSRTPLSLPFFVAMEEEMFAKEGVELDIELLTGGYRTMEQFMEGKADLATPSEAVIMFNSFNRRKFVILCTFVTTHDNLKVVVRPDSGIGQAADLAGKRIGAVFGSASHYYLDTVALLDGVDPKSIQLVRLSPEKMQEALVTNQVDGIAIWHPFVQSTLDAIEGSRTIEDDGFYNFSFNLVTSPELVDARADDLLSILRALDRAVALIRENPARAKAILKKYFDMDRDYSAWTLTHFRYGLELEQNLITELESEARWAIYGGHVQAEQVPNYLDFIDDRLLKRIAPQRCNIVK